MATASKRDKYLLSNSILQDFLAGGFAGIISRTAVAPIERVKILLQVQVVSAQGEVPLRHTSIARSLKNIVEKEGPLGLMKGNAANCVRVFPNSAIQFASYGVLKQELFGSRPLNSLDLLAAGALAGAIAQTVTYPLDLVRAILTVNMTEQKKSILGTALEIIRGPSGITGLFRGLVPSLAGIMPYVGIDFAVYGSLRPYLPTVSLESQEPTVMGKLCAGAFAGVCGQTIAYPFDTVRRILQVQHLKAKHVGDIKYKGMVDCLVGVARRDGVRALYYGLLANYMKVIPSVGINFVIFETIQIELKKEYGRSRNSSS